MKKLLLPALIISSLSAFAHADGVVSTAPEGAAVYFIAPAADAVVAQEFTVKFGLSGMGVAPAGVDKEKTGHHHILIDTPLDSVDLTQPLPATDLIKHFGGGQTEATLNLTPGKHTLQLLVGNYVHVPHSNPVVSQQITVVVE